MSLVGIDYHFDRETLTNICHPQHQLWIGIISDNPDLISKSIRMGAKVNHSQSPLFLAAMCCSPNALKILLQQHDIQLQQRTFLNQTPLHYIDQFSETIFFKYFAQYYQARTPQQVAETVTAFVQKGLEINVEDNFGNTPLHKATTAKVAEALIVNGANINAQNHAGWTPLHRANFEITQILIKHGANLEAKTNQTTCFGFTPLLFAIFHKQPIEKIDLLLTGGADVNALSMSNDTALHTAAAANDRQRVALLLTYGADHRLVNNGNKKAIDDESNPEMKWLLNAFRSKMKIA